MALERYIEDFVAQSGFNGEDKPSPEKWKSVSDESPTSGFECNICLDSVQDPVVTLCGHLYCWPCIYKWLQVQGISTESQDQTPQQCPVCKAEVSHATLVPLYGKGQTTKPSKGKVPHLGIIIPRRPLGPACGFDSPRSPLITGTPRSNQQLNHRNYPQQSQLYQSQLGGYAAVPMLSPGGTTTNVLDPAIGMFGEMVYARVFGNTITNMYSYPNSYHLAGSSSPRVRRHVMLADKSLSRVCFFLFCCAFLCLLLF